MSRLRAAGITKEFPGIKALDRVDFELEKGQIHAIVGENGAGKSTFVKVLAGVYRPTAGRLFFDDHEVSFSSPHEAAPYIGVAHQERELVPFFSGARNLFLGQELRRCGFLQGAEMRRRAHEFVSQYGIDIDLDVAARELSSGDQEMLTILKVLFRSPKVMVFDEPTAALSVKEIDVLFKLIRDLKGQGTSIIYISHHLPEVLALADRITVLRNGQKVATVEARGVSEDELITLMVAKDLGQQYPKMTLSIGADRLRARGYGVRGSRLSGIDFSIAAGEIVGFAGLVGSGRTELAKAVFEGAPGRTGEILLDGLPFLSSNPRQSMRAGVVMIPENRRQEGLVSSFDVLENLSIPRLSQLSTLGVRNERRIDERGRRIVKELAIKTHSVRQPVMTLSGGNQQKVSLGKWFDAAARVWIFDEPTQGIDVETKSEIYGIMQRMAAEGAAIWFISSDLREITAIADRIYVMRGFGIVSEFARPFSTDEILAAMLGKSQKGKV